MATIKGTWKINSVGDVTGVIEQEVNCTSGGLSFIRIQVFTGYVALHTDGGAVHMAINEGVLNEKYQNINFGTTEQTVKDAFYAWLVANATQTVNPEPEDPNPENPDSGETGGGDDSGETGGGGTESGGTDDGETESTGYIADVEVKGLVYKIKDPEARTLIENLSKRIAVYERLLAEIETALAAI